MSIEEARKILAEEGLTPVKLVQEYDNASLYLCKRKNGTEIETVIQDGIAIIAPE